MKNCAIFAILLTLLLLNVSKAEDSLMPDWFEAGQKWEFSNGAEFPPGGRGGFDFEETEGKKALRLDYNFRQGGKYVLASIKRKEAEQTRELEFAVKATTPCRIIIRIVDAHHEHFQYVINYSEVNEWRDCRIILDDEKDRTSFTIGSKVRDSIIDRPLLVFAFGVGRPKDEAVAGRVWFTDLKLSY